MPYRCPSKLEESGIKSQQIGKIHSLIASKCFKQIDISVHLFKLKLHLRAFKKLQNPMP